MGSLKEDIVENQTGLICSPNNVEDLAETIDFFYQSDLFESLDENRRRITEYANEKYSWRIIGKKTADVYKSIMF